MFDLAQAVPLPLLGWFFLGFQHEVSCLLMAGLGLPKCWVEITWTERDGLPLPPPVGFSDLDFHCLSVWV